MSYYKKEILVENHTIVQFLLRDVFCSISEEYIKYFTWKYEWNVDYRNPICGICERLNDPSEPTSILDLDQEFGSKNCKNAEELPWMILRLLVILLF